MPEPPAHREKNEQPVSDVSEPTSGNVTELTQEQIAERRHALAELVAYDQEIGL